ncbi:MAG: hypothetical protein Q7Q71_04150 [Verrucomicrobiota bacterium JB023]|nr:hypothetical protein [Verrucomicrobiota bacterium JB023]
MKPESFVTQSLGTLELGTSGSYEPINENRGRFHYEPCSGDPAAWTALIDSRVPDLNSNWRNFLARGSARVSAALAEQGHSYEDAAPSLKLRHIALKDNGGARLEFDFGPSEDSYYLEVLVDESNRLTEARLNR